MKQRINLMSEDKEPFLSSKMILVYSGAWALVLILVSLGMVLMKMTVGYQISTVTEEIEQLQSSPQPTVDTKLVGLKQKHEHLKQASLASKQMKQFFEQTKPSKFSPLMISIARAFVDGCWIETITTGDDSHTFILKGKAKHPKLMVAMLENLKAQPLAIRTIEVMAIQKVEDNLYDFTLEGSHHP